MPDILGQDEFILRPGSKETLKIAATPASSATANDGSIPYNTNVSTIAVTAKNINDVDKTSELIDGTPSVSSNVISISLKYPTSGEGKYKLYIDLTLDDGQVIPKYTDKIIVEDK
jgi:hypothetical protein